MEHLATSIADILALHGKQADLQQEISGTHSAGTVSQIIVDCFGPLGITEKDDLVELLTVESWLSARDIMLSNLSAILQEMGTMEA